MLYFLILLYSIRSTILEFSRDHEMQDFQMLSFQILYSILMKTSTKILHGQPLYEAKTCYGQKYSKTYILPYKYVMEIEGKPKL